jgi:hypothetical protein
MKKLQKVLPIILGLAFGSLIAIGTTSGVRANSAVIVTSAVEPLCQELCSGISDPNEQQQCQLGCISGNCCASQQIPCGECCVTPCGGSNADPNCVANCTTSCKAQKLATPSPD